MPARNKRSEKRNAELVTGDATALLQCAFDEARELMSEMNEILSCPSAHYDLFPRVVAVLSTVLPCEKAAVYSSLMRDPGLFPFVLSGLKKHRIIDRLLRSLTKVHGKEAQASSQKWRHLFSRLRSTANSLFDGEENGLFPEMARRLTRTELCRLGQKYRHALRGHAT